MASEYYECIKTGATIRVANRYAYGDLFRLGGGYFMHVAQWVEDWHRESINGFMSTRATLSQEHLAS
jgi:hypothetical protein